MPLIVPFSNFCWIGENKQIQLLIYRKWRKGDWLAGAYLHLRPSTREDVAVVGDRSRAAPSRDQTEDGDTRPKKIFILDGDRKAIIAMLSLHRRIGS
jgi:hypothetical protein